ncbi:futalosine hydrolase [Streptomyces sp. WMMC500]|uniref:futalosine hydrolase n=1 Tax=Streptomyces sp. WMMC500 TaxID=3015154 RepID=UPI00248C6A60|nr:futalosine hydrolase [Streptomyces sp. WMMC500]WBB58578.1 futalosine hydrolase [Streptomyces sp. WMMC500]
MGGARGAGPGPGARVLVIVAVAAEAEAVARADRGYDVVVGGVGPAAAAAGAATALAAASVPYDLVIAAGIGGGFAGVAPVGAVVVADEIVAADLGAETPDGFASVTELGFGTVAYRPPPETARTAAEATGAVLGTVLTVSTVTGSAERAAALLLRHPGAAAEAMEGFGVAEAAARHGVPVMEIRAVSNAVGPRDRAAWRIPEALTALTAAFTALPGFPPRPATSPGPSSGPRAVAPVHPPHSRPRVGRPSDNAAPPP